MKVNIEMGLGFYITMCAFILLAFAILSDREWFTVLKKRGIDPVKGKRQKKRR